MEIQWWKKKKSMNYLFGAYWGYVIYFLNPKIVSATLPVWTKYYGRAGEQSALQICKKMCVATRGTTEYCHTPHPSGSSIFLTGSMQIFSPL